MSPVRPPFLQVLRSDSERVGGDAARVLALIRYVTGLPGEHNGRVVIDGEMWWQASHADIGDALGDLRRKTVERIVRKLEAGGELMSCSPDSYSGNQTKAYHIPPDQQWSDSTRCDTSTGEPGQNGTGPGQNRPGTGSNLTRYRVKSDHSSSPTEELIEETIEETDDRASQAIARRDADEAQLLKAARNFVNEHIYRNGRRGRDAQAADFAVLNALREGMPETQLIEIVGEWRAGLRPNTYRLAEMIREASVVHDAEVVADEPLSPEERAIRDLGERQKQAMERHRRKYPWL